MSYGIIRVQKFKTTDVRGIQSHDRRERESLSNPDIQTDKSGDNYSLKECDNFHQAIYDRLKTLESPKTVRKDAVVMCQFLVTSDHNFFKDMPKDKQREFFQQALDFVGNSYGKKNILSATVHLDEKTPHMHVNITPIREGRLTAKEIFNRQSLAQLQTSFHATVGKDWGLLRGESREEKRRHLDTEEFKIQTRREELARSAVELSPSVPFIGAVDVVARKSGWLKSETPEEIATRLNDVFIKPLREKLSQLPALRETAKAQAALLQQAEARAVALQKTNNAAAVEIHGLQRYKKVFSGLTQPQQQAITAQLTEYRAENTRTAQKTQEKANTAQKTALQQQLRPQVSQRQAAAEERER